MVSHTSATTNVTAPLQLGFDPTLGTVTDVVVAFSGTEQGTYTIPDGVLPLHNGNVVLTIETGVILQTLGTPAPFTIFLPGPTTSGVFNDGVVAVEPVTISNSSSSRPMRWSTPASPA